MLKLIKKLVNKFRKLFFHYRLTYLRFSGLNRKFFYKKQIHNNEITYMYFHKKYNKYIKELPLYNSNHMYSNKIWWCWLQGEENAPDLNKACLSSLKRNLKDMEIISINENNYMNYVDFPEYIMDKYNRGIIPKAHFADLIRLELLDRYGGTWIDSSVLCTGFEPNFYKKDLFLYSNWMKNDDAIVASNWFITSEIGNPILKTTKDLLFKYWKDYSYLVNYYIFHIFFTIASEKYKETFKNMWKYSNIPPHILQFELTDIYNFERFEQIKRMTTIHKLSHKIDFSKCNGNTNYDFIIKEYLVNKENK